MSDLWTSIGDSSQLAEVLDKAQESNGDSILILKHSSRCAISSMAKRRVESKVNPLISYYLIDVIRNRDVSQQMAQLTGVQHESPQAFLYHSGSLSGNWSHMDIRPDALNAELA